MVDIDLVSDAVERRAVCATVLQALPDWFEIDEAREAYIAGVEASPFYVAKERGRAVGFLQLMHHNDWSTEVHVMGVLPAWHRMGIGRALIERATQVARQAGHGYLTVKTLAPSHPDRHYAATRAFYAALGFQPLEVVPTLWGSANPCLLMVKPL